jgi:hypothetical protein
MWLNISFLLFFYTTELWNRRAAGGQLRVIAGMGLKVVPAGN